MSEFTRRRMVQTGLAIAGAAAAPGIVLAQRSGNRIIRAVGDVTSYDPVTSTTGPTYTHSVMVYDLLFGYDLQQNVRPQMVDKYGLSDDKLTWSFELRDGLRFHDGTEVTTADVIASIRRWAARDATGQLMMEHVNDISAQDKKAFRIRLKERFGLVAEALAFNCFIMRKKEAETDPRQSIDTIIGSGPFRFNRDETKPGTQYVYDRFADYVPRKEPPNSSAGGKIVKVDRVVYVNMPDQQTAVAAVQAGEMDYYSSPPADVLEQLAQDKNVRVQVLQPLGTTGTIRCNFLHPPFNNVKCRQAILHIVKQSDYLKASIADPKYYRTCASVFACGTAMENDANTGWFKGAPDYAKAKQLLKEGGYDGRPVVVLQPTSVGAIYKNAAEILADEMRRAGINVDLLPLDWAGVTARRASKAAPDQGGWNVFFSSENSVRLGTPMNGIHAGSGEKGWFGWPTDAKAEELRKKWALADALDERKKIARELQENAWNFVPFVPFGQWVQPALLRANLKGVLPSPFDWLRPWWNVEKT